MILNKTLDADRAAALRQLLKTASEAELPFVCIDTDMQVVGPIRGDQLDQTMLNDIRTFRRANAETPYLFSPFHEGLETNLKLDERSHHFLAYKDEKLLGVLRATPTPFEINHLTEELNNVAKSYSNYLEISRMIVSREGRARWAGMVLCFAAVQWGLTTTYSGFVALCRPNNAGRFSFLGFRQRGASSYSVPERSNGQYRFMASDWQEIFVSLNRTFGPKLTAALGQCPISSETREMA